MTFRQLHKIRKNQVRIGGDLPSQIFGTVTADRLADFYFLNSQGFVFGPEARINLSGSFAFLGSDRLDFADGVEFSLESTSNSILSISGPVGFHAAQGSRIEVQVVLQLVFSTLSMVSNFPT